MFSLKPLATALTGAALLLPLPSAESASPPDSPPPVEAYAALPGARAARLSPDGRRLAMIAPHRGRYALVVWDLDDKSRSQVIPTGDFTPEWVVWKSDRRLLAGLSLYSLRDPLRPTQDTRLIAFDADGRNAINLVDAEQFRSFIPQTQDAIVSLLPDDPDHILLALPAVDRGGLRPGQTTGVIQVGSLEQQVRYPEIVQVDLRNGRLLTVQHPRAWVTTWQGGPDGTVRVARTLQNRRVDIQIRLSDGTWHSVQTFDVNSGRVFQVAGFADASSDQLYVVSNHEDGPAALYLFDARSATFVRRIAGSPSFHSRQGRLLGYRSGETGPMVYLDKDFAHEAAVLAQAVPDARAEIVDRSADGQRVLARLVRGNEPPDFWLLNRRGPRTELVPVAETYPDLPPAQIRPQPDGALRGA